MPSRIKFSKSNFRDEFLTAMRSRFVQIDVFAETIALALVSQRNAIFFGPGGHAKSEGMKFALSLVQEAEGEVFTQACGEGQTEERLFGGPDLHAMEVEKEIRFNTGNSFLNPRIRFVVWEEGLSMPDQAVLSMRDTLSEKEFRNGMQRVPLHSESQFILTNEEPKAKATLGDSYKALLERFPIQIRVAWQSYTAGDYVDLYSQVRRRAHDDSYQPGCLAELLREAQASFASMDTSDTDFVLAHLMELAGRTGQFVSPRIAIAAEEIARAVAAMSGGTRIESKDLLLLDCLPSLSAVENLEREIRIAIELEEQNRAEMARQEVERKRKQIEDQRVSLRTQLESASSNNPGLIADLMLKLSACEEEFNRLGLLQPA